MQTCTQRTWRARAPRAEEFVNGMRRLVIIALVGCLLCPVVARADDAFVLPAGRSTTYLENLF
jgi:hypothetical protein